MLILLMEMQMMLMQSNVDADNATDDDCDAELVERRSQERQLAN